MNLKIIIKLLIFIQQIAITTNRYLLKFSFCSTPIYLLNLIILGRGVAFNVPVRCEGWGKVYLADFVTLGFRFVPKYGNGQILIQARNAQARIEIGKNTKISNNVSIIADSSISIGRDCLIGHMVTIFDSDFHDISIVTRHIGKGVSAKVVLGNNVGLGSGVTILKGVSIGDNSIISANSVCYNNIPKNVIVAGNPARIISELQS